MSVPFSFVAGQGDQRHKPATLYMDTTEFWDLVKQKTQTIVLATSLESLFGCSTTFLAPRQGCVLVHEYHNLSWSLLTFPSRCIVCTDSDDLLHNVHMQRSLDFQDLTG